MTENQAVDIYINLLLGEITESVRENIDPKEMKKIKHMLVVKSAKQGPFLDTIKILMDFNLDIKISVLGEETDRDILKEAGISVEKLFVRQGRLDENKVDEWIVCYKRLMRFRPTKQEVNFAIEFLEYELQHSNRDQYSLLLNCAITYLTMYVNPTKAKRAIKKLTKDNSKDCVMPKIEKLFSTVNSNNKILLTCN